MPRYVGNNLVKVQFSFKAPWPDATEHSIGPYEHFDFEVDDVEGRALLPQFEVQRVASYLTYEFLEDGGAVPSLPGVHYAVLMENPVGVASWRRLTAEMVLPTFSCGLTVTPTVSEIGFTVIDPLLNCSYNRMPVAASVSNGEETAVLVPPFASHVFVGSYEGRVLGSSRTFGLMANEQDSPSVLVTSQMVWWPRVYWGVAPAQTYDESFIKSVLLESVLSVAKARPSPIHYMADGLKKMFYSCPEAFGGVPADFIDSHSGFQAGFSKVASGISVTNSYGVVLPYAVWGSDQVGLGSQDIRIN